MTRIKNEFVVTCGIRVAVSASFIGMKRRFVIASLAVLFAAVRSRAAGGDNCAVCGGPLERVAYFFQDKVAGDKKQLCEKCALLTRICYLCGLPMKGDFQKLSDGRILCARDVKNVMLDEEEAQQI